MIQCERLRIESELRHWSFLGVGGSGACCLESWALGFGLGFWGSFPFLQEITTWLEDHPEALGGSWRIRVVGFEVRSFAEALGFGSIEYMWEYGF